MSYSVVGMFSGAGGLDLGFEQAGFVHRRAMDWDSWAVASMRRNRPGWGVDEADAREWSFDDEADVLIGGPPCQGYSLGGHRRASDERNDLYEQVLRVARDIKPRVVVIENVLNLRTLMHPKSGLPFNEQIARDLTSLGYEVFSGVFRVDGFGVPQTRRRWIFIAWLNAAPEGFHLPLPHGHATVRPWLEDLASGEVKALANHAPSWTFASSVHEATGLPFDPAEAPVIARFSRTASDGNPLRSLDQVFPAVDTATIWGWAQGHVKAERIEKNRANARFVRNPEATAKLWRISASRLRAMTARELARLQTFPDEWAFVGGGALRDIQLQVGNAVPVKFAKRVGESVIQGLEALDAGIAFDREPLAPVTLF
jgi:DNA (cytosine-5)-methyltransferase 1